MIGVVGPAGAAERLAGAVEVEAVTAGTAGEVLAASPTVAVAVGEPALSALVDARVDVPVLPVDLDGGLASVSVDRAPAVLERGLTGGFATREWPVIEAALDGQALGRGVLDAMLVTAEPARISEFSVATPGGTDQFRADGVVVATPAGSAGYTRTLGGPVLDPDAGSLVVVPVAAFTTRPTVRVASAGATLSLSVERDEGDVSLLVDGEDRGRVPPGRPLTVGVAGAVEVVSPSGD